MKTVPLTAGAIALLLATVLLILTWSSGSLLAHMIVHMTTVAIAAPFLAVAISGGPLDPRLHRLGPVSASILELLVVWFWHVPAFRRLAETRADAMLLEQAGFLVAGLILWVTCFRPREEGGRRLAGTVGLLFTSIHMTLLGVLLTLAPRPFYGAGDVSCLGITLSREADQQLGGVAMLMVGAASYLLGAIILLADILKPAQPERCR